VDGRIGVPLLLRSRKRAARASSSSFSSW
jgi:hypothetical protein